MITPGLPRRLAAEALGSFFLFAGVIGSGVMAEALAVLLCGWLLQNEGVGEA